MPNPGELVSRARFGTDRNTGKLIYGWDHCLQSIGVILTTAYNTRVMRLEFGSDVPRLIDKPAIAPVIMMWYGAIAKALRDWEPGYRVRNFSLLTASADGQFGFSLDGVFYPYGHLGDYSIFEFKTAKIIINTAAS